MLLRSASTPVLGSLLPSFSDGTPNNNPHHETPNLYQNHCKLSFYQTGSLNLSSVSCNSSPISPSVADSRSGFRRVQSDGNLEGLAAASCNNFDESGCVKLPPKHSRRSSCPVLQTIPSFSFYGSKCRSEDDVEEEEEEEDGVEEILDREDVEKRGGILDGSVEGGKRFMATGSSEFGPGKEKMGLVEDIQFGNANFGGGGGAGEMVGPQMYLAKGLGVSGGGYGGGGGGGGSRSRDLGRDGGDGDGDGSGIEEYYKRTVEENPGNPLFLRNYAQFLYHSKKDLHVAEEYYSRAILADPKDGEILAQYAKLIWERHGDKDRTSSYFQQAVQADPEDSHVLAAYASFLWETEEDQGEDVGLEDLDAAPPFHHKGTMVSASAGA
ncbi:uncharacterized protein LOC131154802 [Malania oleifera]|uniref:uncharacterized protein LOC131154802 n=1 Tax=Malania oleifera TaxID=397392 RepID=UPI0025ADFD24|nr:uncharacterized protein LOC131154802 [Malania oleifera]XP_057963543.1 uncharacterized protein LOC131154802 [Malania oleifera]